MRILQFLTFSERPLRIDEAVDAIAVQIEERPRFDSENRMPVPKEILGYCSSLVAVVSRREDNDDDNDDDDDNRGGKTVTEIQLAHFSVKEYLVSDRLKTDIAKYLEEIAARASIAEVCLAYSL